MKVGAPPPRLLIGRTLEIVEHPFFAPPEESLRLRERGGVLIEGGRVSAVEEADVLRARRPEIAPEDLGRALILPGFVDCHVHYPQTAIIAGWARRLIDWLNDRTFPEEARFADPAHAAEVAETFLDLMLAEGTTTASVFATVHAASAEAILAAAHARGLRLAAGRVLMDRNAPAELISIPRHGLDECQALIDRWHGVGRLTYAVTPRFAPTSTPAQLEAAGALRAANPGVLVQTHLSEQPEEVAWVAQLFPEAADYLAVYESAGLSGAGAIMGHAIHLTSRERRALAETGTAVAHCPTSNAFLGSGACAVADLVLSGVPVGLATDVGGGSSFSMLRTMAAAYEVSQTRGAPLHPAQLLWLATEGSAAAMRLKGRVGRLAPGADADLIALDPEATPLLAQRTRRAESAADLLFALQMLGDDRAVRVVAIGGRDPSAPVVPPAATGHAAA